MPPFNEEQDATCPQTPFRTVSNCEDEVDKEGDEDSVDEDQGEQEQKKRANFIREEDFSSYEEYRAAKIRRNEQKIKELGLTSLGVRRSASTAKDRASSLSQISDYSKSSFSKPTRRSPRLLNMAKQNPQDKTHPRFKRVCLEKVSGTETALPSCTFQLRLEHLKQFKQEFGHINVPRFYKGIAGLFGYIENLREHYKNYKTTRTFSGPLNEERVVILNEIGMVWDPVDHEWEQNYEELKRFHSIHGHFCVSDNRLGRWVATLRASYYQPPQPDTSHYLTPERIYRLDLIGFDWN